MSVDDSASKSTAAPIRTFIYSPMKERNVDPMLYGAYSRWKKVELEKEEDASMRKSGKSLRSKKSDKKSDHNDINADSFYNAIRNLGRSEEDEVNVIFFV
jgi:hypothetical protein